MNTRRALSLTSAALATALALSGCGAGSGSGGASADGSVEITLSGWNLSNTPEFKTLADGFMKDHTNVKVTLKEYSADDYDSQVTVDISGGATTDVVTMKNMSKYYSYATSGGLMDITDIATDLGKNMDVSVYDLDGKYFAVPYRTDSWVMFYNKDMFAKAGVAEPKAGWTWDDFIKVCEELKAKLPAAGYDANAVKPTYMHSWQTVVQSFALAQTKGADYFSGDYSYMKPYYERALKMQDEDLTLSYSTATASKVQYQAQFGNQKAAMVPMGSWYIATLLDQQKSGAADTFEWGMVSVPQNPDQSVPSTPETFGSSTGFALSSKLSGAKLDAAREFVKWACGEGGATALAGITSTPAYMSDAVATAFFAKDGMPTDDQSKAAWSEHKTTPDTPIGAGTAEIQALLNVMHSAIMTGTKSIDKGLTDGTAEIKNSGALDAK